MEAGFLSTYCGGCRRTQGQVAYRTDYSDGDTTITMSVCPLCDTVNRTVTNAWCASFYENQRRMEDYRQRLQVRVDRRYGRK